MFLNGIPSENFLKLFYILKCIYIYWQFYNEILYSYGNTTFYIFKDLYIVIFKV